MITPIPFLELGSEYASLREDICRAIEGVFQRGTFILGSNVARLEEEFAQYCGVRFGVGVASGTDALHLALRACGVGSGDEVITTPFTSVATVVAITMAGATPVFADVDPDSLTLAPDAAAARITDRTRALLPVHLYGQPADMAPLLELAREHDLKVIEDVCQAHGAEYGGRKTGSLGDAGCFSFYPTKNLGAYGDGGMVVTDDPAVAERLRLLRQYGWRQPQVSEVPGFNSRLDELQASILRVKLPHLEEWNRQRAEIAARYAELLRDAPGISLPQASFGTRHVYHLYAVRSRRRDALREFLAERGVGTGIHYPLPVHLHPAYDYLGFRMGTFPNAEQAAREVLSLPLYPQLPTASQETVAGLVRQFFGS